MTVSDKKRPLTFVCIEKNIVKAKLLLSGLFIFWKGGRNMLYTEGMILDFWRWIFGR